MLGLPSYRAHMEETPQPGDLPAASRADGLYQQADKTLTLTVNPNPSFLPDALLQFVISYDF